MARFKKVGFLVLAAALAPAAARAQDLTGASDVTRYLLDTALLIAGGLGGLLTVVALAMRDIGLARSQNTPAVCLRTIGALSVSIFAFWLVGYHLLFGVEPGGFLGPFQSWTPLADDPAAEHRAAGAHWFFHATLAALGAAIISASLSERVRLWPFLFFTAAWAGLIYPICASWAWGGGYCAAEWSFRDLGGAGVLHAAAGAAALAAIIVVGPRSGRYANGPGRPPVSTALPLSAFGVGLALAGLLMILAGLSGSFSSIEDGVSIGVTFANAMIAIAGGSLAAMILTQTVYKRAGLVSAMTGAIGGLVSISGDPVTPLLWQAAMIGAIGGVIVTVAPPFLDRMRFDDAGFSIPAHFLCGLWGVVIAFWPTVEIWLPGQLIGAAAVVGFSFTMSLLFWVALKYTVGVRAAPIDDQFHDGGGNR